MICLEGIEVSRILFGPDGIGLVQDASCCLDDLPRPATPPNAVDLDRFAVHPGVVHLLARSQDDRPLHSARYRYRLVSGPLPPRSFIRVSSSVAIPCPELFFVEMAASLSHLELLLLGYELCGTYVYRPCEGYGFSLTPAPLTSARKLVSYISALPRGLHGAAKAARAAQRICDGSMSPAETFLILRLCLPGQLGGYALPFPASNARIALDAQSARFASRDTYRADLVWADKKVVLEYDGARDHSLPQDIDRDAKRRNRLQRAGYTVITVTRSQVRDAYAFDEIAEDVHKAFGMRHHAQSATKLARRQRLFEQLQASEHRIRQISWPDDS